MFEVTERAWHNGALVSREKAAPSIASHSLHLGIGVFDGMMAYWNENHYYVHRLEQHLDRLSNGSTNMGLPYAWTHQQLADGIQDLLAEVTPGTYYIRPIAYRSGPQINVTGADKNPTDVAIFGVKAPRNVDQILTCHISPYERVSSRAMPIQWKICGTYVNSYLARRAAQAAGFSDGLMLDRDGRIAEASAANLFLIQGTTLVTPALSSDIFPGITRYTLLDLARILNIEVVERDIYPSELSSFDGAFLASTLMELKPIGLIEKQPFNTAHHPCFRQLLMTFRDLTHQ